MMKLNNTLAMVAPLFILFSLFSCSTLEKKSLIGSQRLTSSTPKASFPDQLKWQSMFEFAQNLDLNRSDIELKPSTGGTSVYAIIKKDEKYIGAVIPENSASILSGEIGAFNISRALGVSELYQPAAYHFLSGKNLAPFKTLIEKIEPKTKNKEENKKAVLSRLAKHPEGIPTAFKQFDTKPVDYDAAVEISKNTLNGKHILKGSTQNLSTLLSCRGTQPSSTNRVFINGGTTSEKEALKQLSSIFLIDAMTQQWDRFSGGNLQTVTHRDGIVQFVSYDNGGTWGGPSYTQKYLSLVSRFDREVAQKILQLDDFFQKQSTYMGLSNDQQMIEALDLEAFSSAYQKIKSGTAAVAQHIRANPNCFFE